MGVGTTDATTGVVEGVELRAVVAGVQQDRRCKGVSQAKVLRSLRLLEDASLVYETGRHVYAPLDADVDAVATAGAGTGAGAAGSVPTSSQSSGGSAGGGQV